MNKQEIKFKDLKEGEAITGYFIRTFKNPKSLNPDADNIELVSLDKTTRMTVWSAGKLKFFSEEVSKKGLKSGTAIRIVKTGVPEWYKPKNKKQAIKDFYELGINTKDTVEVGSIEGLNYRPASEKVVDEDGFEF